MQLTKSVKNILQIKNYIKIWNNGEEYIHELSGDDCLHIFDELFINIYLDQFTEQFGKVINFDDITDISILKYGSKSITQIPVKIQYLYIKNLLCTQINLQGCKELVRLHIDYSNIKSVLNMRDCTKLAFISINHSNLSGMDMTLPYVNLKNINLSNNNITSQNINMNNLVEPILKNKIKTNLSYNSIKIANFNDKIVNKCVVTNQHTEVILPKINYKEYNANVLEVAAQIANNPVKKNILKNNNQTVHISSITQAVVKSVSIIKEYIETHELNIINIDKLIYYKYNKDNEDGKDNKDNKSNKAITTFYNKNKQLLNSFFTIPTSHSITKLTYKETFELVITVLKHKGDENNNLDDLIERMQTELLESNGMCFIGIYNRLINVLVSIIDGVNVGISSGEEIQMEFGKIMERYNKVVADENINMNDKNNVIELNKRIFKAFSVAHSEANEILENTTTDEKNAWIEALNDYEPDPIPFIENNNEEWDGLYRITWDNKIINVNNIKVGIYENEKFILTKDEYYDKLLDFVST